MYMISFTNQNLKKNGDIKSKKWDQLVVENGKTQLFGIGGCAKDRDWSTMPDSYLWERCGISQRFSFLTLEETEKVLTSKNTKIKHGESFWAKIEEYVKK